MTDSPPILYCANHPKTETTLRCSRCEKPICPKCAVSTPTGYRCKECVHGQQKAYNTAEWYDYLIAFLVAGFLSFIGSWIVPKLGFFTIFLAPIAGMIIAEAVRFLIRRRRSRSLFKGTAVATTLGSLPILLTLVVTTLPFLAQGGIFLLLGLVWQGLYTFIVTTTVYYRIAGIQLRA